MDLIYRALYIDSFFGILIFTFVQWQKDLMPRDQDDGTVE